MAYRLEGTFLEVCSCDVLCPCWIGEDPDNGTCQSIIAWNFEKGEINGVEVSGLSIGAFVISRATCWMPITVSSALAAAGL